LSLFVIKTSVLVGNGGSERYRTRPSEVSNWVFTEDVLFTSPSAAAACIVGGEANGLIMWVDEHGKKLKELQK